MINPASSSLRRSLFNPAEFTLTFELVPGRSARSKEYSRTLAFACQVVADGRLQAVSITENAGGHPALSPEVLGLELRAAGLDVIIHLSCKDKNRNQLESLLYAWDQQELNNLLVITGDYPQKGYEGSPKPVFDLGSVQALDLISRLNRGSGGSEGRPREPVPPTSFVKGVAVSPFKASEAEQMMQYFKLHRKAAAGADFVITQLGYDARKFQELLFYMREQGLELPVLGNVFIPNLVVLEHLRAGRLPGCYLPESLYRQMRLEAEGPDQGRRARLLRAAKLLAVLKGLGFAGAHIGGPGISFADLDFLLNHMETLTSDWQRLVPELSFWPPDGFWFYKKEEATGLNRPEPTVSAAAGPWHTPLFYQLARTCHKAAFARQAPLYASLRKVCQAVAGSSVEAGLARGEHLLKYLLFGCRNCGDCTLAELAYLCPQAGCAKFLLNGPCGGSRDGWCEVYPGRRRCFYVRLYERLRSQWQQEAKTGLVPPRDWSLDQTSSWLNYFLERDHAARQGKAGDQPEDSGHG
jgi:methylenetetrahydrofolate reductase (NADPH)